MDAAAANAAFLAVMLIQALFESLKQDIYVEKKLYYNTNFLSHRVELVKQIKHFSFKPSFPLNAALKWCDFI